MKAPLSHYLIIPLAIATLTACAPFRPDSSHAGACNELNSRMIFSGSTSDVRRAEIQNIQEPLVQRTYDRKCES